MKAKRVSRRSAAVKASTSEEAHRLLWMAVACLAQHHTVQTGLRELARIRSSRQVRPAERISQTRKQRVK